VAMASHAVKIAVATPDHAVSCYLSRPGNAVFALALLCLLVSIARRCPLSGGCCTLTADLQHVNPTRAADTHSHPVRLLPNHLLHRYKRDAELTLELRKLRVSLSECDVAQEVVVGLGRAAVRVVVVVVVVVVVAVVAAVAEATATV
jgi:hypothetical protein